jgi:hypothetical protein
MQSSTCSANTQADVKAPDLPHRGLPTLCWHRWSKWTQYEWHGTVRSIFMSESVSMSEGRQRRTCVKCGKMQDEKVYY